MGVRVPSTIPLGYMCRSESIADSGRRIYIDILGFYRYDGKEKGNYYLGLRVWGFILGATLDSLGMYGDVALCKHV